MTVFGVPHLNPERQNPKNLISLFSKPIGFGQAQGNGAEVFKNAPKNEREFIPADAALPVWTAPSVTDVFTYQPTPTGEAQETKMTSLINGGQIFSNVSQLMNNAKQSVMLNLYNLQNPALYPEKTAGTNTPGAAEQAQVIENLIALKKKGLSVKVILDNHYDKEFGERHNDRTIQHLRNNGVEVVTYPDFSKISHVKLLIVDGQFAVIGGMNWGNHSTVNHDAAVMIEGPDVRNIYNQVFKTDWVTSGGDVTKIPDVPDFAEGKIKVLTTSQSEAADGGSQEIFHEIIRQIGKAEESIYAELFVLTQQDIIDNLIFAHKRLTKNGKEGVKLLIDPGLFFAFPNTRKGVQKLAAAGIPVKFYKANRNEDQKLHAKWAVFDRKKLMIGSANWSAVGLLSDTGGRPSDNDGVAPAPTPRTSKGNHEANVLIESEKLAKPYVEQFWFDWRARSFPILEKKPDGSGGWQSVKPSEADAPPSPEPKKLLFA